jgi:hypothetical protein
MNWHNALGLAEAGLLLWLVATKRGKRFPAAVKTRLAIRREERYEARLAIMATRFKRQFERGQVAGWQAAKAGCERPHIGPADFDFDATVNFYRRWRQGRACELRAWHNGYYVGWCAGGTAEANVDASAAEMLLELEHWLGSQ